MLQLLLHETVKSISPTLLEMRTYTPHFDKSKILKS